MMIRLIRDAGDLRRGVDWLAARDAGMARAADRIGLPRLRLRAPGFAAIFHAIVGQQVSTASAAAIWARVEAAGLTAPQAVVAGGPEALRAVGLTRPKQRYVLGIAAAAFDWDSLAQLPDEDLLTALIALPGVGRWTAEIYALLALGRADVFPAGDLALQEAARTLYGWDARPTEADLRARAEDWRPWRGVAARLLWDHYRLDKGRDGIG